LETKRFCFAFKKSAYAIESTHVEVNNQSSFKHIRSIHVSHLNENFHASWSSFFLFSRQIFDKNIQIEVHFIVTKNKRTIDFIIFSPHLVLKINCFLFKQD
jgi:hypothetical protein